MFDIGFVEMLVIAIVGMVVVGPERLPGVARTVGRSVSQLRNFLKNLQNQLEQEVKLDELKKSVQGEPDSRSSSDYDKSVPSDEVEPPMPTPPGDQDAGDEPSQAQEQPDRTGDVDGSEPSADEPRQPKP